MGIFLKSLHTAYVGAWNTWLDGQTQVGVIGFVLFVAVAIGFYAVFEKTKSGWSLRDIWNYIFPRHLYANCSARIDIWNWILVAFLWTPLTSTLVAIYGALVGNNLSEVLITKFGARATLLHSTWLIVTVQASVLFLAYQFVDYWVHRAMHRVPLFWSFHRSHHSSEALNFFTAPRSHPFELIEAHLEPGVTNAVFGSILFYLTGTPLHPLTITVLTAEGTVMGLALAVAHSHIPVSLGKLNYVFGSSVMHQIHHSREAQHRDKNFGTGFMLFDWLFGTLYMPKPGETYHRWGISEDELGERNPHKSLRDLYLEPFSYMWGLRTARRNNLANNAT